MENLFIFLTGLSPELKKNLWRWWYQLIAQSYQKKDWQFMNYGFADLNLELPPLKLSLEDEDNRYFLQLYYYVTMGLDLRDKKVLEVGCGRGGGAHFIAKYLQPETMIGLDFCQKNINLAQDFYHLSNLSFCQGDAENLPFLDNSFDGVINVESSHCYGSMANFLREVKRVIRPFGFLAWADLCPINDLERLELDFANSGLTLIKKVNITPQVLKALEIVNPTKQDLIKKYIGPFWQKSFQEFAGIKDSKIYQGFRQGQIIYLSCLFQKVN